MGSGKQSGSPCRGRDADWTPKAPIAFSSSCRAGQSARKAERSAASGEHAQRCPARGKASRASFCTWERSPCRVALKMRVFGVWRKIWTRKSPPCRLYRVCAYYYFLIFSPVSILKSLQLEVVVLIKELFSMESVLCFFHEACMLF